MRGRLVALVIGWTAALGAGQAAAQQPVALRAVEGTPGWIALRVTGAPRAVVALSERTRGTATPLRTVTLPASGRALLRRVAPWRCDRRVRRIAAVPEPVAGTAPAAGASVRVATPSCGERLTVAAPRRGAVRRAFAVRVADAWRSGELRTRVCADTAGARPLCRAVTLNDRRRRATVRLRPSRGGRWGVQARTRWQRARAETVVAPGRVTLLATGDSEIQGIDELLAATLRPPRGAHVISDAHISTGISKPVLLDWVAHARFRAARDRPDVTVVYIGGNEGFPVPRPRDGRSVLCCGGDWVAGYERRVVAMMRSWSRQGRGRVYWFTLPAPSSPALAGVFRAVNTAIVRAARRFPETVRVVDIRPVFTPGGTFRQAMEHDGRWVTVRESDGYHLSFQGNRIATDLLVRMMREDGAVA